MKLNYNIGDKSLEEFRIWLNNQGYTSCFVLTDQNTSLHCYPLFSEFTSIKVIRIEIPAGEKNKTLQSCEFIWKELMMNGADRKSLLINLGGGMITDIGGFVASAYMRGIDYVNIPTSLLCMIDAAIGGKTAVDLDLYKNMIGSFYEPVNTIIFPGFLKTLDQRQLNAAFGEIIKYNLLLAFISLKELSDKFGIVPDEKLIRSCINSKIELVRDDPYEKKGIREYLNLGHTFGHAFETLSFEKGKDLLHGEAVALGLIAERCLSQLIFRYEADDKKQLESLIFQNFDKNIITGSDISRIISIVKKDKKNAEGKCKFILIDDHGKIRPVYVNENEMIMSLEQFISL